MANTNKKSSKKTSNREFKTNRMNRRNSSKRERRDAEAADVLDKDVLSKSNPYTWYANFPNYAKDVASLAFGIPVGQPIPVGPNDYTVAAGVMAIEFIPSPGISKDLTSPLNRQAARFQTYLRSIQRSAANYDAADTMMYMLAIDSLYMYWAFLRRVYGVAQLFTPTNKYYPRRLIQAMGVDPDDIMLNLADFRAYVNRFALNIGRFALPKEFDLIQRHMWMCNGLYTDSPTTRAQTYVFVPYAFWVYNNTVTTGSQLDYTPFGTTDDSPNSKTFSQLVQFGDQMVKALENDDDTMSISGDMYRAYGPSGLLTVEETGDNYAVLPVYDETVLSQIENSVACGAETVVQGGSLNITQNPSVGNGAILYDPYFQGGNFQITTGNYVANVPLMTGGAILNMHMDSPSPEQVMEATRLTSVGDEVIDTVQTAPINIKLAATGADIVVQYRIGVTSPANSAAVRFLRKASNTIWIDNTATTSLQTADVEWLALSQQFDWGPMTYLAKLVSGTVDASWIAADIDNMTYAQAQQIFNIHEAATLSLLDITAPVQK